jgi:IS1 family transposase
MTTAVYVQKKRRHVRKGDSPEIGDQWVFVAIDAETKLVPSFHIGKRHYTDTVGFLWDQYKRMEGHRIQITTDGLNHYKYSSFPKIVAGSWLGRNRFVLSTIEPGCPGTAGTL